jgi:hypothetical protein
MSQKQADVTSGEDDSELNLYFNFLIDLVILMFKSKELLRSIWSPDRRYLILAHAKFRNVRGLNDRPIAKAIVIVFEGDPAASDTPAVFSSYSELHSYDLLDELQNAERIGRDFVASIR